MPQLEVLVALFSFQQTYSYTVFSVSNFHPSCWTTLFQQIIPWISSEVNVVFEDNENIKAIFISKKRHSSLDLSSAPLFWISIACTARRRETATVSTGITQAHALWDVSDLLSSELTVLASQLPLNETSYLALSEDVKVCSCTLWTSLFKICNINTVVVWDLFWNLSLSNVRVIYSKSHL